MQLRTRAPWILATVVVASSACLTNTERYGPSETGNASRYAYAPVAAGIAVAGAAISRAGGGCFAVCAYGTVCNPDTGACVDAPEATGSPNDTLIVPFGADPEYGVIDPVSPGNQLETTVRDPPGLTRPMGDEADLEPSVDACTRTCKLDEICERNEDDVIACIPKGPLPDRT